LRGWRAGKLLDRRWTPIRFRLLGISGTHIVGQGQGATPYDVGAALSISTAIFSVIVLSFPPKSQVRAKHNGRSPRRSSRVCHRAEKCNTSCNADKSADVPKYRHSSAAARLTHPWYLSVKTAFTSRRDLALRLLLHNYRETITWTLNDWLC